MSKVIEKSKTPPKGAVLYFGTGWVFGHAIVIGLPQLLCQYINLSVGPAERRFDALNAFWNDGVPAGVRSFEKCDCVAIQGHASDPCNIHEQIGEFHQVTILNDTSVAVVAKTMVVKPVVPRCTTF